MNLSLEGTMMNERDKMILRDIELFRCMSRDQLATLHFSHLKNPVNSTNSVLKRLTRDGYIKHSNKFTPYVYFPSDSKVKENSQKIPHFLAIVDVVIEMKMFKEPKYLMIEPKFGPKGGVEPDIFCLWYGNPILIEVQRNIFTSETMQKKITLYETFYYEGTWKHEPWQNAEKPRFPSILILTTTRYPVQSNVLKINQAPSINDFIQNLQGDEKPAPPRSTPKPPAIKSNNGSISLRMK